MEVIDLKLPSRGFSTSEPSAARCLVDQAQGNLGPESGQADVDLDITVSLLLERLQQEEETRVTIYSSLQEVLQRDIKSLDRNLVRRIIHLASKDMRETQQENDEVQLAAGKTLVALAGTFYNWVMYELQCHMGIMELPPIYFLITLGDVASAYALRSEPFLVLTLSKLRFVLRLVETDQMKRALCGVVEGFAQAANLKFHIGDESPFPSCRAADYGFHVLPFFNLMSSSWLTSEDLELQQAAVKALGPAMGLLLHHERHRSTVFERLPCLLQQYEGGVDNLHVTMSLSRILEVAYDFEVPLPDGKLKSICFALHTQVCDIAQLPGSENQVKVFYCLRLLACLSPDQFISLVGSRLKTDKEGSCVASLSIFSGIIAADLPEMSQKKCAVVKAMRCTLGDQSTEVKKAVLHFIRTLLSVQGLDDWAWDLVAYIFKQSSLSRSQMKSKNRSSQDAEEEQSIRITCVEILENLDVSISGMSQVLWSRLLEYIVPAEYSCTLTPLCRCLGDLAEQPQWEGEAACMDPSKGAKFPKAQGLLARLLVVASALGDSSRAHSALRALWALHRTIHPAVGEQWRVQIPILLSTIEGNPETSQDNVWWEHLLLKFLNVTLKSIDDDAWSSRLSLELQHQTASYACSSPEKSFLYKALGTTLASCQDVAHVKSQLQKSLKGTDYMNAAEREHVVTILAFSAEGHLDLALGTLEDFGAALSKVQVSGIVGRLQDYHQGKRARTHRALILAYSRIAVHAPRTQLLPRVEHDITRKVLQYYMTSCQVLGINFVNKDPDLKLTLIRSVTEISRAIQDADDSQSFQFAYKEELLGYLLDFMKEEPMDSLASPVRLRAMLAIKHLSKVKPSLNRDENRNILDDCLKCLLPLPAVQQLREEGETSQDSVQVQALHELSMQALGELMRGLLEEDPTENWFMEMFHLLEPWIFSDKEWERDRALQASSQLLVAYQETVYCRLQEPLEQFGSLLGLLAPYTCTSLAASRLWAADCIFCLLQLQGQARTMDAAEGELRGLREELKAASPEAVLTSSCQMAKVTGKFLPSTQALDLVGTIMDGMLSASPTCATAAGHWFCAILRENGDALLNEVPDILSTIFRRMPTMQERSMRGFLLEGVGILAVFHLEAVITSLLAKPLPMDSDTSELWRALGRDDVSTLHILRLLLEKIQYPAGTEGSPSEGTAALGPLAATCASLEMLTTMHSSSVLRELLPELLCALLEQVGHTVGQDMPMPTASIRRRQLRKGQVCTVGNPCRLSMETLACAISKGLGERVAADLSKAGTWPLLESPQTHHEGVCQLARTLLPLGIITPQFIGQVLKWASSPTENLRVTGTAFISQLMCDPVLEDQKLLKAVLSLLQQRARDTNNLVQQMAARGLGNIVYGAPEQLQTHQKAVVETLFQASFVPARPEIREEGMRALTRVFKHLGTDAGPLVEDAAVHIRPLFNHDNDGLRAAAFSLFGALAGCMKRRQAFYKIQVRQSLGTLLLHLEDPNPQVAKECRTTLGLCCPYLGLRRVQAALAFHTQGSEQGKQEQLLRDVCRHLAREKPALLEGLCQAAQGHYSSPWPEIQMAAIKFTGILMEYAAPRSAGQIKVARLLSSLRTLGQDTSQEVQDVATQVAEAISKSPWGSILQEEENHGHTLPYITSLLCFGCLRPRSI